MKPLVVLARITFVGCLWSIIFIEGVRVIMLENWHFDIFWPPHWAHAWNLWLAGWVIDTAKEWAFVLILVAFLPLWLTGWIALSMIPWESLIYRTVTFPFKLAKSFFSPLKIVSAKAPVIVKKKSYKEIRPTGPRKPIYDYNDAPAETVTLAAKPEHSVVSNNRAATTVAPVTSNPLKKRAVESRETFSHSLFNLDDGEDDFELDFGSFDKDDIFNADKPQKKSAPEPENYRFDNEESFAYESPDADMPAPMADKPDFESARDNRTKRKNNGDENNRSSQRRERDNRNGAENNAARNNNRNERRKPDERNPKKENADDRQRPSNPVADVLSQKGYDVINGITVHNHVIDFIGVAENKISVCLIDKEPGDWLADEERFNNEEPLWFSESSHRISPVRKIDLAKRIIADKLAENDFELDLKAYVVIQTGNIINAEDMFEIWQDMGIEVTRINRGSPKEIKLFSKTLEDAENKMEPSRLGELKKLLRSLV